MRIPSNVLWNVAPYVMALFTAAAMGLLAAKGQPTYTILFAGALSGLFLMTQPIVLLWLVLVCTLVVAGSVMYFIPTIEKAWWAVYLMGAMLFVPAILTQITHREPAPPTNFSPTATAALFFMVFGLLSTVVNKSPTWQVVLEIKSLFLFAGIWAALASLPIGKETMKRWLTGFAVIGLIQWLPALYQYIFVRSSRLMGGLESVTASDSVVGTFGGSMESGGLTGALAAYLIMLIVMFLSFYRDGLLRGRRLVLFILLLGTPLLFMEVKVIFLYLPITLFILYKDTLRHRPLSFFTGTLSIVALLALLLLAYQTFHWSSTGRDLTSNVEQLFSYSFEEQAGDSAYEDGVMTRREVVEFWWHKHSLNDPIPLFLGHGLGSSRTQGLTIGNIATQHFPKQIDRTGLAHFLWDVGLLGVTIFLLLLVSAYRTASRLARSPRLDPWQRSLARGLQAIVPMLLISFAYRSDIPYAAPMMFLFMTILGLLAWLDNQERQAADA